MHRRNGAHTHTHKELATRSSNSSSSHTISTHPRLLAPTLVRECDAATTGRKLFPDRIINRRRTSGRANDSGQTAAFPNRTRAYGLAADGGIGSVTGSNFE